MEQVYKRVDDIDEKLKSASLPYIEWKVLFLVGESTNAEEISSLLSEESSSVPDVLVSLESKGLIEKVEAGEETAEVEETVEEEPVPSIGDELLVEEEETVSPVSEELEEQEPETVFEETEKKIPEEEVPAEETPDELTPEEPEVAAEPEPSADEEALTDETFKDKALEEPEIETEPESEVAPEPELEVSAEAEQAVEEEEQEVATEPETETPVEKAVEETPADTVEPEEEIISEISKKTIMVVDDSIVIRKMIEIALEEEDFKIVTAMSGKEGLEVIDKENPNLVILDMMLPDMNGIEVLKTIKEEKNLPVIMLSGKDSPQLIESAKEVGVDDFLPKPFRDEELVEKVKTLIGV